MGRNVLKYFFVRECFENLCFSDSFRVGFCRMERESYMLEKIMERTQKIKRERGGGGSGTAKLQGLVKI